MKIFIIYCIRVTYGNFNVKVLVDFPLFPCFAQCKRFKATISQVPLEASRVSEKGVWNCLLLYTVPKQTDDRRYFYCCYDKAMGTSLIKVFERAASTSGGKCLLVNTKRQEEGKRSAEEDSDTNDTTFQLKWQK